MLVLSLLPKQTPTKTHPPCPPCDFFFRATGESNPHESTCIIFAASIYHVSFLFSFFVFLSFFPSFSLRLEVPKVQNNNRALYQLKAFVEVCILLPIIFKLTLIKLISPNLLPRSSLKYIKIYIVCLVVAEIRFTPWRLRHSGPCRRRPAAPAAPPLTHVSPLDRAHTTSRSFIFSWHQDPQIIKLSIGK